MSSDQDFLEQFIEAILFVPMKIILSIGPFYYYMRSWETPASFLTDFSMICFTVGMFALIVDQNSDKFDSFDKVGSQYLLSGALSMTTLFITPFFKDLDSSSSTVVPSLVQPAVDSLGSALILIAFVFSLVGSSVFFGLATADIIKSTSREHLLPFQNNER